MKDFFGGLFVCYTDCMLLIWQRFGFLVPVIGFGSLVLTQLLVDTALGKNRYENDSALYAGIALFVASGLTYLLNLFLSPREQPRKLLDPVTQQTVLVKRTSTFFFVPVVYWSYLFAGLAVLSLVVKLFDK